MSHSEGTFYNMDSASHTVNTQCTNYSLEQVSTIIETLHKSLIDPTNLYVSDFGISLVQLFQCITPKPGQNHSYRE